VASGILSTMQDADDFDFIWLRLVIVDDVLLDPNAAASGKEVVS
jgi:hypothetical protein